MSALIFCWSRHYPTCPTCVAVSERGLKAADQEDPSYDSNLLLTQQVGSDMKLRPKYEWCRRNGGARKPSVLNLSHGESVPRSRCIILRLTISKSQSRNQRCQCTMAFDRARIANKWRVIVAGWRANHWYASLLQTIRWVSSTLTLPLNIFRIPSSLHTRKVLISMHWIFQDIPRKILKDIIYRDHIFSHTPHQQEDFQGISSLGIVFS